MTPRPQREGAGSCVWAEQSTDPRFGCSWGGVLQPYGQDPASPRFWPPPSSVLAELSGHHGGKMAISASGFPGGGLARESISPLQSRLKGRQLLTAHPEVVTVAGGGRGAWCLAVDWAWVSAPLLGTRGTEQGGGFLAGMHGEGPKSRCPTCLPTLAWPALQHGHTRAPLPRRHPIRELGAVTLLQG